MPSYAVSIKEYQIDCRKYQEWTELIEEENVELHLYSLEKSIKRFLKDQILKCLDQQIGCQSEIGTDKPDQWNSLQE